MATAHRRSTRRPSPDTAGAASRTRRRTVSLLDLKAYGVCRLPGLAPTTRLFDGRDAYDRPFAALEASGRHTVVLEAATTSPEPPDAKTMRHWISQWAERLAQCAEGFVTASLTVEPWFAETPVRALRIRIGLGYRGDKADRRDTGRWVAVLGSRIPGLAANLTLDQVDSLRPLSAARFAAAVKVAYDPSVAHLLADVPGNPPRVTWNEAAPTITSEAWDHFGHDGARSVTWAVSENRDTTIAAVLADWLGRDRLSVHRRATVLYRRPHGSSGPEFRRLGVVLTATATGADAVVDASAAVRDIRGDTRVLVRRVYGSQASAFAAGLFLALEIPENLRRPQAASYLRERPIL